MPGSNIGRKQEVEHALSSSKDTYVLSYSHLKGRPHEEKAIPMLRKVASLVKPIMRKHGWTLPLLSEFFPDNPSLVGLNVNGGQQILLRLRPAWAPDTFYDEEQVVSVMLHELTHNVHGPHDSAFYSFLSKLEAEYADLQRSGYSGEGFFSKGTRLGDGTSHNIPPYLARIKTVEAAEKRARVARVLGSGGSRLGGAITIKSPRELAAEAAERRARDEKSCGHGHSTRGVDVAKIESEKAAREGVVHKAADLPPLRVNADGVIDLTSSDEDDDIIVLSKGVKDDNSSILVGSGSHKPSSGGNHKKRNRSTDEVPPMRPASSSSGAPNKAPASLSIATLDSHSSEWSCTACTYINSTLRTQCEMCLASREPSTSDDLSLNGSGPWTCWVCGQKGIPHEFWTCGQCGWVKVQS